MLPMPAATAARSLIARYRRVALQGDRGGADEAADRLGQHVDGERHERRRRVRVGAGSPGWGRQGFDPATQVVGFRGIALGRESVDDLAPLSQPRQPDHRHGGGRGQAREDRRDGRGVLRAGGRHCRAG